MNVVLLVMKAGDRIEEPAAPGPSSPNVREGRIRFVVAEEEVAETGSDTLLTCGAGVRQAVEALSDAVPARYRRVALRGRSLLRVSCVNCGELGGSVLSVFGSFPLSALAFVFAAAAGAVWVAGIRLSSTTDVLLERFGLGQALGGLILLAIVTNLPEIAITASASLSGELGIAVGNILGGIAIQTAVLVLVDAFGVREGRPLSYRAASLSLVLEGTLVIIVLAVTVMSSQLPPSLIFGRVTPGGLLIVACWGAGIVLLYEAQTRLPWSEEREPPGSQRVPKGTARARKYQDVRNKGISTTQTLAFFAVASVITLIAGVALEQSGEIIAGRIGMNGILFGSTVLAAATALPEVSTGLAAAKLGDYKLAVSDIFGGNAFLPVLFFLAGLLSGQAVFPQLRDTDMYLIGLGILLTCVYIYGLIFRPRRTVLRMGMDSLVVLVLYLLGTAGLVLVGQG